MSMKSMKLDKEAQKEMASPCAYEPPAYPYGLRLSLDQEALEKLGIKALPKVGEKVIIQAIAEVCDTSAYESAQGGERKSLGLQITDLSLDMKKSSKETAKKLYGE